MTDCPCPYHVFARMDAMKPTPTPIPPIPAPPAPLPGPTPTPVGPPIPDPNIHPINPVGPTMPTIPPLHPRIFWTPARKVTALTNITNFGFTPNYGDPWSNLLAWCVQGDTTAAANLLTQMNDWKAFMIATNPDGQCWQSSTSGCDQYR